ncbi:SGNH hydrolase-like domain-containing protein, acetyltransferase AlgX [Pseudoxanthobacter soli DSM 19599]|uniref:SGNH hydrolase-like domain-containing protein, acetyltransferase AlgX n=1 Tax=Pseudoxanthobacter soli DSM 19599 TaxID=1123029 RepID=A0A1M7ZPW7_9HYPH|nr:hypothetical protein [Pseudoxanthobacter soli]SHO66917.1 SGNH hydrolase-like domain-containing protein, acetyltransferase AlgX [Pseudoxanthobacter soli DSM 19599]
MSTTVAKPPRSEQSPAGRSWLADLGRRCVVAGFVAALMVPGLAIAISPNFRSAVGNVLINFSTAGQQREIVRNTTPLWTGAADLYGHLLYRLGTSPNLAIGVLGKDDFIFLGDFYNDSFSQSIHRQALSREAATAWAETLAAERDWLARRGIPMLFVVGPTTGTIYPDKLPDWAQTELSRPSSFDEVLSVGREKGLNLPLVDVRRDLIDARSRADTYSRLNSHWNDFGAWVAWQRVAGELGARLKAFKPFGVDDLTRVVTLQGAGHSEFARLLGLDGLPNPWNTYELSQPFPEMEIEDAAGNVSKESARAETGLLDMPRKTRVADAPTRARALIVRDSMGNGLSPFLQASFSETVQIDHHVTYARIKDVNLVGAAERYKPDVVIYVMTERLFEEPLGDLDFWRAANLFDEGDAAADLTWRAGGESHGLKADGDTRLQAPLAFTAAPPAGTAASAWVLRVDAGAAFPGTVRLDFTAGGVARSIGQTFRLGENPMFFRLPGDVDPASLRLVSTGKGVVDVRGATLRPVTNNAAGL